ncbi:MFS transporter [Achromobacter aegrifaciens]|uniref:Sialic acid transporter n=1 Tax=Achromobacter aegrifaciens TaxID=1287736 RepID=A0AAD2QDE7_ACHAE|nr:MFS transporter [Achromobacter aegrifaciens]CUJ15320.1 putative sialic acid transporter [Achromobacter aegrifaciens]
MLDAPGRVVGSLGTAQTLAWASSYYLPAMLADPMARDLGVSAPAVYAAFSAAMVASAVVGPWAGLAIDRHGGRVVLAGTSLLFALGLGLLGAAQGLWTMVAAWLVIGVAMGAGLYEAAFSSLVRLYGHHARGAITGITLIAGFASTVGWPLSAWMETQFGWRGACLGWAGLHLLVGLPLNAWFPKAPGAGRTQEPADNVQDVPSSAPQPRQQRYATALLAFVFAATWFISTAMATHLPRMLEATGATLAAAVAVGALIGPAQVAGRLLEFGFLRRVHPLLSARLAALAHPAGVALLLGGGPVMAPVFAVLHGAGNGILTIAKGTLPLVLFGPQGYGARQGWLMMPARVAQALAPFLFGVALDRWGGNALWLSGGIGLGAFAALLLLRARASAD